MLKYPRIIPACAKRTIVSFSDGEGTARVAGAIWVNGEVYATRGFAPPSIPKIFPDSEAPASHINCIEALGPLLLLSTYEELFEDALWLHFIDNSSALGSLVKGHSSGHALSSIASAFWSLATRVRAYPWFFLRSVRPERDRRIFARGALHDRPLRQLRHLPTTAATTWMAACVSRWQRRFVCKLTPLFPFHVFNNSRAVPGAKRFRNF